MIKRILLILLCCLAHTVPYAQTVLDIPTQLQFKDYLQKRQKQIEIKLYGFASENKIKAYYNPIDDTFFPKDVFKLRGSGYTFDSADIDSSIVTQTIDNKAYQVQRIAPGFQTKKFDPKGRSIIPFNPEQIVGINFVEQVTQKFENKKTLKGIELLYNTGYRLCYLSLNDIKNSLSNDDMTFLELLYHYSSNQNFYYPCFEKENIYEDPFSALNQNGLNIIHPDTTLYIMLGSTLEHSNFYISSLLYINKTSVYTYDNDIKSEKNYPWIYDEQQNRLINIVNFKKRYFEEIKITYSDKDSIYKQPFSLEYPNSVTFNSLRKNLTDINFEIYPKYDSAIPLKFRIHISNKKQFKSAKPIIWFYEDYIRWKKL